MKSLIEGLLDDNIFNDIDKAIATDWLQANVKSQYKVKQLKTGELKVWGKLVIKKVNDISMLNISQLDGDLYIENCDVTSLNSVFADFAKVTGSIYITNCPKLTDITGLPRWVDGEVSISNCSTLKSLDGVTCHASDVTIMKCGKKFSKDTISKAFNCAIHVHCSEEELVANILEAFQDPVLTRMFDQLKKQRSSFDITNIIPGHMRMSRISPSMRDTYKYPADLKKILTMVRKICANKGGISGFILTEDWDGNFVDAYTSNQYCYHLQYGTRADNERWGTDRTNRGVDIGNSTAIVQRFENLSNIKYVHVYTFEGSEDDDRTYGIQIDRQRAKEGMIPQDKAGLEKLLRSQRDRYKTLVKQLKATRESDKYKVMVDKVDKIMERFTKFMHKYIADPKWAGSVGYKADLVFDAIRKGYVQGSKYQEYGVLYTFQNWAKSVVRTLNAENTYSNGPDSTELEKSIDRANKRLLDVGM